MFLRAPNERKLPCRPHGIAPGNKVTANWSCRGQLSGTSGVELVRFHRMGKKHFGGNFIVIYMKI